MNLFKYIKMRVASRNGLDRKAIVDGRLFVIRIGTGYPLYTANWMEKPRERVGRLEVGVKLYLAKVQIPN